MQFDQRSEGEYQINENYKLSLADSELRLKKAGSNQTAHFRIETPGGDEYHDPLAQAFEINRSQVNGQE